MIQLLVHHCLAQRMDLKELTELLDVPVNKLDNVLQKKGFRKDAFLTSNDEASLSFLRSNKEGTTIQYLWLDEEKKYVYETNSVLEFSGLRTAIKNAGFISAKEDSSHIQSLVYQKQVITIETSSRTEDTTTYYVLKASKKDLPKKKDMLFAEDLLVLDSHEYLSEMFGKENVKADIFYYAEDDSGRCSVILPGTNREAIIIWKDEVNLRNIDFIIIGGSLRSQNTDALKSQGFNAWRSNQGVYCGMSLKELEMVNREPVKFFNWHTESPGHLIPKNKGQINFDRISLILNCMNCSFIKVSQGGIADSYTALNEMQKVFVTALIILPSK